jgi:acyl carrier protein
MQEENPDIPPFSKQRAENVVLEAFRQVLGVAKIDRDSPFGALGGDSMRAVRVLSRVWRELGLELPLQVLGSTTTPAELAAAACERAAGTVS